MDLLHKKLKHFVCIYNELFKFGVFSHFFG